MTTSESAGAFNEEYFHEIAAQARDLANFLDKPFPGIGMWALTAGDKIDAFYKFASTVPSVKELAELQARRR